MFVEFVFFVLGLWMVGSVRDMGGSGRRVWSMLVSRPCPDVYQWGESWFLRVNEVLVL